MKNKPKSDWHLPADLLAMFGMGIIPLTTAAVVGLLFNRHL
jgi:hypothetical protein